MSCKELGGRSDGDGNGVSVVSAIRCPEAGGVGGAGRRDGTGGGGGPDGGEKVCVDGYPDI